MRYCSFAFILLVSFVGAHGQQPTLWGTLYSADARVFAANLRQAGAPEATVALLVSQEINARFKQREAALQPSLKTLELLREGWSSETREALLALKHERNALLRNVLGQVPEETAKIEHLPDTLSHLSPEMKEKVRLVTEDYDAMRTRIYTESRGSLLEEDRAKLRYLQTERHADLVKLLGADDALDYQIYDSGYLKRTQSRLELAKPTAREIREMFLIRQRLNLDIELSGTLPPAKSDELGKQAMSDLAQALPPQRFAEISRAGSRRYQQIYHLVRRLGGDTALAADIYAAQSRMNETAMNGTKSGPRAAENWKAGQQLRAQLMDEHVAYVKRLLGEKGYLEYYAANQRMIDLMYKGGATAPDTGYLVF